MSREEYLRLMVSIRRLNFNVLRRIEIEMDQLQENYPEMAKIFVNIYTRMRKGILDEIGNVSRTVKEDYENVCRSSQVQSGCAEPEQTHKKAV